MIEDTRILSKGNVYSQCKKYVEGYKKPKHIDLAYLSTDGNQWIDTGFTPNNNTRVVMDVFLYKQPSYPRVLFGARKGSTTSGKGSAFCLWAITNTSFRTDYGSANTNFTALSPKGRRLIDKNKKTLTVDTTNLVQSDATFDSSVTMRLFTNHSDQEESIDDRQPTLIFYSCQIYDNGMLIRDFVPVLKNGTAQLYDKIEKKYYPSKGNSDFISGPELHIPPEYTPVEYIESDFDNTGNAPYIDTGIQASDKVNANVKFKFSQVNRWQHSCVIGGRAASTYDNRLGFSYNSSSGWRFDYKSTNYGKTASSYLNEQIASIVYNFCSVNDGTDFTATQSSFTGSYTLWLFAYNTGGSVDSAGEQRIYWCDIDASSGERAFRPVKRNSDGLAGMYDLVEKKFYTCVDSARKKFIAGPETVISSSLGDEKFPDEPVNPDEPASLNDVDTYLTLGGNRSLGNRVINASNLKYIFTILFSSELPSIKNYIKLEYIASSGTQYINTDFIPNSKTRIVMDAYRSNASAADHFFGVRTGSQSKNGFAFYIYNSNWRSGYGNEVLGSSNPSSGRYLIDKNKNLVDINNGSISITNTEQTFTCEGPAYLFAMNSVGSNPGYGTFRLYSCKIYDDGILVRDFIPVKRLSDKVVCLYDKRDGKFYTNSGSGSFTAGPEI